MAGMKACHFVRNDHEMPPFFLPLLKTDFFFCQNLKDILFLFCGATRDGDETLKMECLQAGQMCPFDRSDKTLKEETERSAKYFKCIHCWFTIKRNY